jgi:hypothetical protein
MTDITTNASAPPTVAPAASVAPVAPTEPKEKTYSDLEQAIFTAIREELDLDDLSDADIDSDLRVMDKLIIPRADNPGENLFVFEIGSPYPGLAGSKIVALFLQDVGDSPMPGEVRIYVEPSLPLAGAKDHICYALNRVTLGMAREVMTRAKFASAIGAEYAASLDLDDDDEDDEEEEGLICIAEDCEASPTQVCDCSTCSQQAISDRVFAVCADPKHLEEAGQTHLKELKRPPKWTKVPAAD